MEIDLQQAATQLARLIDRALDGEDVVITKAGKPVVRLTPVLASRLQLGTARGTVRFKPGWDEPLSPDVVEKLFGH